MTFARWSQDWDSMRRVSLPLSMLSVSDDAVDSYAEEEVELAFPTDVYARRTPTFIRATLNREVVIAAAVKAEPVGKAEVGGTAARTDLSAWIAHICTVVRFVPSPCRIGYRAAIWEVAGYLASSEMQKRNKDVKGF